MSESRVNLFRRRQFWYLNYRLNGQRIKEATGLTSKTAAEKLRIDREKSLVTGQVHHLTLQKVAVGRAYAAYLRDCKANFHSVKTIDAARGTLKKFFRWSGFATIDLFTTAKVKEFFAYRVKVDKLIQSSLRRNREALHAFFNFVKGMDWIEKNPVTDVKAPRIPDHDICYLKLGEIVGCLKAVAGHMLEALIACAIYSGLRRGELCWLTWDDVDLTEKKPLLRVRSKTIGTESWVPKTKKNRLVPIHQSLVPYLAKLRMQAGEIPWVFRSPEGCRWDPDNLGHHLSELMEEKGLEWGFLEFRHTYGSQLAIKGMSLLKIAKLMGNSYRIAERHYATLQTEDLHDDINFGVEEEKPTKKPARLRDAEGPTSK